MYFKKLCNAQNQKKKNGKKGPNYIITEKLKKMNYFYKIIVEISFQLHE